MFLPNKYNVLVTKYLRQYQEILFVLFLACKDALTNFLYLSKVGLTPIVFAADSVAAERPYSNRFDFEGKIRSESKTQNRKVIDSHQRNPQPYGAMNWRQSHW